MSSSASSTSRGGSRAIEIDGSAGEGGGQILRTSLSCAVLCGCCVRIVKIRANRPKPGLQRQHLACVEALAALSGSTVTGGALGSCELTFDATQAAVAGGAFSFSIGSAGSTTLVLQTLLPVLLRLSPRPSSVSVVGGTHNPMAPSFDFLADTLAPALGSAGARLALHMERPGFYPAGGGTLSATVQPWADATPLELRERGALVSRSAVALLANLPSDVGRRECGELTRLLGWPAASAVTRRVEASGSGNALLATLRYANVSEVICALGERGKRGEAVASEVAAGVSAYEGEGPSGAPVSEHLADQLLLPLLVGAGGVFECASVSSHLTTNAEVLRQFFGRDAVVIEQLRPGRWQVTVAAAPEPMRPRPLAAGGDGGKISS